MPKPAARFITTLVCVLIAFSLYATFAVPAIERPPPSQRQRLPAEPYVSPVARFQPLISAIFPPESWERGNVRVLKTSDLLVVFGAHETVPGGGLVVRPVSIAICEQGLGALTTTASETSEGSASRVWIIRAPGGARLQFDSEVDLERGSIGKLQGATIEGSVSVTGIRHGSRNEDPVEILAENLQYDGKRLWSRKEVHLRWGASQGTGRDLNVVFADKSAAALDRLPGTRQTAVETLGFSRLDRFHLVVPRDMLPDAADGISSANEDLRIDAGSSGPLLVDFTRGFAELRDKVWLSRPQIQGGTEELRCERVSLAFSTKPSTDRSAGPEPPTTASQFPAMQLDRVSIFGQPATITSIRPAEIPSPYRSIMLEAGELHHEFAGPEGLRIVGPGNVRWQTDKAEQPGELRWGGGMVWHRMSTEEIVVLEEDVTCRMAPWGSVAARTLRASFAHGTKVPGSTAPNVIPKAIAAKGNVRVSAEVMDASTNQLDLEFAAPPKEPSRSTESGPALSLGDPHQANSGPPRNRQAKPNARFQVFADQIKGRVIRSPAETRIDGISLEGQVRAARIPLDPGQAISDAWELQAKSLRADRLESGRGDITLRGEPARFRAQQLDLVGGTIRLDQAANRCWMEGPGTATLPLPDSLAQQVPRQAAVATVSWRQGLEFDGQILRCQEDVTVRGPTQLLRCPTLSLTLDRPIRFQKPPTDLAQRALAETRASGGVFIENRVVDERGVRSIDQAELQSLAISHAEGKLIGEGPGWMRSVSMGNQPLPGGAPRDPLAATGLTLLHVLFEGDVLGSLRQRHVRITREVRGIYSPVSDWAERVDVPAMAPGLGPRENPPGSIPPKALFLRCQELHALQLPRTPTTPAGFELTALGNTLVEGASFTAQAHRLSFEKGKDMLVLEGTERTFAHITYQDPQAGRKMENSARKIEFLTKTNQVKGLDIQFLEFSTTGKAP